MYKYCYSNLGAIYAQGLLGLVFHRGALTCTEKNVNTSFNFPLTNASNEDSLHLNGIAMPTFHLPFFIFQMICVVFTQAFCVPQP